MANLLFVFTTPYLDTRENDNARSYGFVQRFATVYAQSFIEWTISVRRMSRPTLRGNIQLQVFSRTYRTLVNHRDTSCLFTLVKCNKDNSQETLAEMDVSGELDGAQNTKFVIQSDNKFTQALRENLDVMNKSIKMTLNMKLPRAAFEADCWAAPLPPTPLQLDYTFDCIDNPASLDLKLVCRDGEFQVNKAALWRCAPGLRKILEATGDTMKVDVSLQTAKTVVIYMVSHTFLAPPEINKKLLAEAINWVKTCAVAERASILTAYENFACMQIENLPLEDLLKLLLAAIDLKLDRLEVGLSAVIIRSHYIDMKNKYGPGTKTPLSDKLTARTAHRGQSPLSKLDLLWKAQLSVHLVEAAPAK